MKQGKQQVPVMRGLYDTWKQQESKQKEQDQLHEKHKIKDSKVVIVEKYNILKYIAQFGKMLANIVVFILAAIGLTCIIYPDTRQGLYEIFKNIWFQLTSFL